MISCETGKVKISGGIDRIKAETDVLMNEYTALSVKKMVKNQPINSSISLQKEQK